MKRILVTGGAGYIGSHTAKQLAAVGFEPIVLDNLSEGHRWAVQWGPLVVGDLSDKELVSRTLAAHNVDAVVHFAASAYVGESVTNPRAYFQNNVVNTLNLLDCMLDAGVRHIVFSSTCATYGDPQSIPLSEGHRQLPVNPYGESKLFVERALRWYENAFDLSYAALRYFNAAGADADGEIGEEHDPETHLIPLAIQTALGQRPELQVFGSDYPTPDGTAIRDYIHVTDLANGHVRALEYLQSGGDSIAVNLGTGQGNSIREVIRMVESVSGRTVAFRDVPRRAGDPPELVADPRRAREVLKWQPELDFETIVATAWKWHESRVEVPGA